MSQHATNSRTIGAVKRSFAIIQHLEEHGESGVSEIAAAMEMPKSTVYKHLHTLQDAGYVRKRDGAYRVGFKFLKHGGAVRDQCGIYTYGRPKVEQLAEKVDEMVILSVREGSRGVFLFRSNDQYNLKRSLPLGERFYLHQNGAGKAMLAALDPEEAAACIDEVGLPASTDRTITDREELFAELEQVRTTGFAVNNGERDADVFAVSAPIHDDQTGDIGAISISVPSGSPTTNHLEGKYAEIVQQAASELSLQLRHR